MRTLATLFLAIALAAGNAAAQRTVWAGAPAGLSLRQTPSSKGTLIRKIPFGKRMTAFGSDSLMVTEGFVTFWTKVRTATDSGYAVDAYLLPLAPPAKGTASLKDWATQMGKPVYGPVESDREGIKRVLKVFGNGAVLTVSEGYEYYAEMLVLPDVSVEEAYLLARSLVVPGEVLPRRTALPRDAGQEGSRSWRVAYRPDEDPYLRWAERLHFSYVGGTGAEETVDIVQLEDGAAISYSTGS